MTTPVRALSIGQLSKDPDEGALPHPANAPLRLLAEGHMSQKYADSPMAEDVDPTASKNIQYIHAGGMYRPIGPARIVETLPAGAYEMDIKGGEPVFIPYKAKTDDLIEFVDSAMEKVIGEVDHFWTLGENFKELGYLHRRGILMHGAPGTGKSSLVEQITERMRARGDLVFHGKGCYRIRACLEALRGVEKERPAIVVLEDLDEYIQHDQQEMLNLLDGAQAFNRVCYLGTTNYIERFPDRLLRPGRFDRTIPIDPPTEAMRYAYLKKKLETVEDDAVIRALAEKTANFSFGHLRELVIAGYAFQERDLDTVIARLRSHGARNLGERAIPELKRRTLRG